EQHLAHALVHVVAGREGHPAVEDEDALDPLPLAHGEDARLPAAQDGAQQLGHARGLDLAADDEGVVLSRTIELLAHRRSVSRGAPGRSAKKALSQSIGTGKMIVEFFSAAISVRVCR